MCPVQRRLPKRLGPDGARAGRTHAEHLRAGCSGAGQLLFATSVAQRQQHTRQGKWRILLAELASRYAFRFRLVAGAREILFVTNQTKKLHVSFSLK
jgi:hypothetical protein